MKPPKVPDSTIDRVSEEIERGANPDVLFEIGEHVPELSEPLVATPVSPNVATIEKDWLLDDHTKSIGRIGVAEALRTLDQMSPPQVSERFRASTRRHSGRYWQRAYKR